MKLDVYWARDAPLNKAYPSDETSLGYQPNSSYHRNLAVTLQKQYSYSEVDHPELAQSASEGAAHED